MASGVSTTSSRLWERYYAQGQGYPEDGFQAAAEEVAGRPLDDFFALRERNRRASLRRGPRGRGATREAGGESRRAGRDVRLAAPQAGNDVTITTVLPGSPAETARILRDDVLVSVGGEEVVTDLHAFLDQHARRRRERDRAAHRRRPRETGHAGGRRQPGVDGRPVEAPTERQLRLRAGWPRRGAGSGPGLDPEWLAPANRLERRA